VKVSTQDGIVTLTGTVNVYSDKEEADNKAHHRKNVNGVQNQQPSNP
jgi:osmotically-inducible protein OsmY